MHVEHLYVPLILPCGYYISSFQWSFPQRAISVDHWNPSPQPQVICWWHYQRYGAQMLLGDGHRGFQVVGNGMSDMIHECLGSDWMLRCSDDPCQNAMAGDCWHNKVQDFPPEACCRLCSHFFTTHLSHHADLCAILLSNIFPSCLHLYRLQLIEIIMIFF